MRKKCILVFSDWYAPGYKAGGPIRSCVNFAQQMRDTYDIYIFTSDRDLGDKFSYEGITTDKWINGDGIKIFYASPENVSWKKVLRQLKLITPDFIYLNSMFSRYYSLYPLLMKRLGYTTASVVLAPRGMLKSTAIQYKTIKKSFFLKALKAIGVPELVCFHATDEKEVEDIFQWFGVNVKVQLISNFAAGQSGFEPINKPTGHLRLIFVGRVHPIKNLLFLLQILRETNCEIHLTIVAAIEDKNYWEQCQSVINAFPERIKTILMEDVPHSKIECLIKEHHLFVLPTLGENFGHAIFEALAAGRPVLISDQTPWKGLALQCAGWDIPLNEANTFKDVIEEVAAMDSMEFLNWCKGAWQLANDCITRSDLKNQYLKLFS